MRLFKKQPEQGESSQAVSKSPKIKAAKYPFSYSAIVIDHPAFDTDIDGLKVYRSQKLPKEAILTEGDKIRPILIYRPEYTGETLIPASSNGITRAKIRSKTARKWKMFRANEEYDFSSGWYFLTPRYIYTDPLSGVTIHEETDDQRRVTVDQFIEDIAHGKVWDSVTDIGPYQLGQDLELDEMDRLQAHIRARRGMRNSMYDFIKTFTYWALAAIIILGIIMISTAE